MPNSIVPQVCTWPRRRKLFSDIIQYVSPEQSNGTFLAMLRYTWGCGLGACVGHSVLMRFISIVLMISLRGRRFDVHPLDLVVRSISDNTKCVGSIVPQELAAGGGEFDILAGDIFLRNVYTMCDDLQSIPAWLSA